eukprot:TRINITY_DN424_c2_g1_i1.p1 TRINITY_DN424_c2_g1~~TRINITY_DN424_c2_g1_i1.p1  ORF type:complete len:516 (-),score=78.92 TRINITY_DN424_c2_g1_i1:221-1768(-)
MQHPCVTGLLLLHGASGRLLFYKSYAPNFGLPSSTDSSSVSSRKNDAFSVVISMSNFVSVLYSNISSSARKFVSPPLELFDNGNNLLIFERDFSTDLVLVLFVQRGFGAEPAKWLAQGIVKSFAGQFRTQLENRTFQQMKPFRQFEDTLMLIYEKFPRVLAQRLLCHGKLTWLYSFFSAPFFTEIEQSLFASCLSSSSSSSSSTTFSDPFHSMLSEFSSTTPSCPTIASSSSFTAIYIPHPPHSQPIFSDKAITKFSKRFPYYPQMKPWWRLFRSAVEVKEQKEQRYLDSLLSHRLHVLRLDFQQPLASDKLFSLCWPELSISDLYGRGSLSSSILSSPSPLSSSRSTFASSSSIPISSSTSCFLPLSSSSASSFACSVTSSLGIDPPFLSVVRFPSFTDASIRPFINMVQKAMTVLSPTTGVRDPFRSMELSFQFSTKSAKKVKPSSVDANFVTRLYVVRCQSLLVTFPIRIPVVCSSSNVYLNTEPYISSLHKFYEFIERCNSNNPRVKSTTA